jgi:hypothetical protein
VSPQDESQSAESQATRLRWLARGAVVAVALWFIADGLRGMWSGAGVLAQVLIVVAAVLVVAFGVVIVVAVVVGLVAMGVGVLKLIRSERSR